MKLYIIMYIYIYRHINTAIDFNMNETNTIMVCVQIGKKVISKAPFLVGPISPRKRAQMQAEEAAVEGFWG